MNRIKYIITPEMDREIIQVYQTRVGMGSCQRGDCPVLDLARRLDLPRWKITRRAIHLGVVQKKRKEPIWSKRELEILERHAHKVPEVIQKHLTLNGFRRSVNGIVLKRKRMRLLQNLSGQSATDLAVCFGVDFKTVRRWIRFGYLRAEHRGTRRNERNGGDMYFIRERHIKSFILNSLEVIDLRKVDKYWFVDLLMATGE